MTGFTVGRFVLWGMTTARMNMSPKQRLFLEWLCTPRDMRPAEERTQAQFAKNNGLGRDVLAKWRADPDFRRAWDKRLMELQVDPENLDAVMTALVAKAKAGSERAIGMYMDVVRESRPPEVVDPREQRKALRDLTDDELRELISEHALAELEERLALAESDEDN